MEDLLTTPGSYTFVQAVHLASRHVRQQTLPVAHNYCRFSVNPSLAFPPADIESLSILSSEDGPPRIDMMLNLLGLHGADSPLPAYFTEHVAQHSDDPEPDPLQDFFNIFNNRIILVLHAIWGKYRYYARYARNAEDAFSQKFYGFIGVGPRESRTTRNIQWPRLMAYMGLIAMSGDAAGSLESILRHYFNHSDITIIPCIPRWVLIPPDQQTVLGIQNCILGETFILGDEIRDQSGKFRICIDNLDWQTFISFLPCYAKFEELKAVVNFALRSRLSFDVELKLKPGEIRPWILGDDTHSTLLGWSIWNTTQTEGIVVLETDFGEL
jgi:type VI secretion system protein ImpH